MAKFLNTTGTNYYLEELINSAKERLTLISPFLKLNDRIKELLEDKDRLKIDIRIIYGKSELHNDEINWLKELTYVRTSFCKNLHAKCYMNENDCIITSMNLYEFSQVNNNEMGVAISRVDDPELYKEAHEEAQRIIRISDEVRISVEKVRPNTDKKEKVSPEETEENSKLTTSKLAKKLGLKTDQLMTELVSKGFLGISDGKEELTDKGKNSGGESKKSRYGNGSYFLWDKDLSL